MFLIKTISIIFHDPNLFGYPKIKDLFSIKLYMIDDHISLINSFKTIFFILRLLFLIIYMFVQQQKPSKDN